MYYYLLNAIFQDRILLLNDCIFLLCWGKTCHKRFLSQKKYYLDIGFQVFKFIWCNFFFLNGISFFKNLTCMILRTFHRGSHYSTYSHTWVFFSWLFQIFLQSKTFSRYFSVTVLLFLESRVKSRYQLRKRRTRHYLADCLGIPKCWDSLRRQKWPNVSKV